MFAVDVLITGFGRSRWRNRRLDRRLRRWRNIGAVGDAAKIQVEGRQQLKARAGHTLVLLRRHGVSTAQLANYDVKTRPETSRSIDDALCRSSLERNTGTLAVTVPMELYPPII